MVDARYTCTAGIPAVRVGALIARARCAAGVSERDVALRLRVRLRTLRDWEQGEVVPTDEQIEAIADACGVRVTELLPRRDEVSYDPATGTMRLGRQAVVLPVAVRNDNDDILSAYLALVRQQRGLRPGQEVVVRTDDLEVLADALDLDDEDLEERLVGIIGLSRRQAAVVRAKLLRKRLTVGMVGMVAGFGLVAANRIFSQGTEQVHAVAGGRLVRGNGVIETTTSVARPARVAPPTAATSAPSTAASSTTAASAPTVSEPPPTLPAIVLAEELAAPTTTDLRTGPARTTPQRPTVTTSPVNAPVPTATTASPPESVASTPTTVVLPGPPTLPPTTPTTPTVPTIGGDGTTGTTEPTPTTTEPTTTTTTEPPPTDPTT